MAVPPIDSIDRTTSCWLVVRLWPHTAIIGFSPRARAASAIRRHAAAPMPLLPPLTKTLIAHSLVRAQLGEDLDECGRPPQGGLAHIQITGTRRRSGRSRRHNLQPFSLRSPIALA